MEQLTGSHSERRTINGPSRGDWVAGGLIALATCLGVFALPFLFPPTHPSLSASYSSGFNNRVAVLAVALMAAVSFGLAWRSRSGRLIAFAEEGERMGGRVLTGALAACAVFTVALGWLLTKAGIAYHDNLYFLEYMDQVVRYHRHIYKDFAFIYGPILLYFPVAFQMLLRPFHAGVQASYFTALTAMELLGIVLLYYTLEALPLSRRVKTIVLAIFTLGVLCPLMGLNYNLVRALLPFSTLLFVTRVRRPLVVAALLFFGELLQLAMSPELGVAFAAGGCFYALCRTLTTSRQYLPGVGAAPLAALVFLSITGRDYLSSMSQFSKGSFNLVVQPLPYMLFFLFALVWMVPRMLGLMLKQKDADAIGMMSLFVTSMAMVPAALGLCDPLHVFFNGAGVYLLAAVASSTYSKQRQDWWLIGLALMLLCTQAVNARVYFRAIQLAARLVFVLKPEQQEGWFQNFTALEGRVDKGTISVPFFVPFSLEQDLKRNGLYQPDRECFYIGVWDAPMETARAERMNQTEWAIVPVGKKPEYLTADLSRKIVGVGFHYPDRRPPYPYGQILLNDLSTRWTKVAQNASWILYHNDRFVSRSAGK